jgi:hypothetical protein
MVASNPKLELFGHKVIKSVKSKELTTKEWLNLLKKNLILSRTILTKTIDYLSNRIDEVVKW